MTSARFMVDGTGLHFDRDYGIDKRTGWTVVVDGCVKEQFVPLRSAVRSLARRITSNLNPTTSSQPSS